MTSLNLSRLIEEKRTTLTAWVEFTDGVAIELEYAEPAEIKKMLKRSRTTKYKKHQPIEGYDDDLYARQIAPKVKNWKGLTLGKLAELINIAVSEKEAAAIVEFNQDNLAAMFDKVPGFLSFVSNAIADLGVIRAGKQEAELKNLKPSAASSSD